MCRGLTRLQRTRLTKIPERKALTLTEGNVAECARAIGNRAPTPGIVLFVGMPTRTHCAFGDRLRFPRPEEWLCADKGGPTTSFLEEVGEGHHERLSTQPGGLYLLCFKPRFNRLEAQALFFYQPPDIPELLHLSCRVE